MQNDKFNQTVIRLNKKPAQNAPHNMSTILVDIKTQIDALIPEIAAIKINDPIDKTTLLFSKIAAIQKALYVNTSLYKEFFDLFVESQDLKFNLCSILTSQTDEFKGSHHIGPHFHILINLTIINEICHSNHDSRFNTLLTRVIHEKFSSYEQLINLLKNIVQHENPTDIESTIATLENILNCEIALSDETNEIFHGTLLSDICFCRKKIIDILLPLLTAEKDEHPLNLKQHITKLLTIIGSPIKHRIARSYFIKTEVLATFYDYLIANNFKDLEFLSPIEENFIILANCFLNRISTELPINVEQNMKQAISHSTQAIASSTSCLQESSLTQENYKNDVLSTFLNGLLNQWKENINFLNDFIAVCQRLGKKTAPLCLHADNLKNTYFPNVYKALKSFFELLIKTLVQDEDGIEVIYTCFIDMYHFIVYLYDLTPEGNNHAKSFLINQTTFLIEQIQKHFLPFKNMEKLKNYHEQLSTILNAILEITPRSETQAYIIMKANQIKFESLIARTSFSDDYALFVSKAYDNSYQLLTQHIATLSEIYDLIKSKPKLNTDAKLSLALSQTLYDLWLITLYTVEMESEEFKKMWQHKDPESYLKTLFKRNPALLPTDPLNYLSLTLPLFELMINLRNTLPKKTRPPVYLKKIEEIKTKIIKIIFYHGELLSPSPLPDFSNSEEKNASVATIKKRKKKTKKRHAAHSSPLSKSTHDSTEIPPSVPTESDSTQKITQALINPVITEVRTVTVPTTEATILSSELKTDADNETESTPSPEITISLLDSMPTETSTTPVFTQEQCFFASVPAPVTDERLINPISESIINICINLQETVNLWKEMEMKKQVMLWDQYSELVNKISFAASLLEVNITSLFDYEVYYFCERLFFMLKNLLPLTQHKETLDLLTGTHRKIVQLTQNLFRPNIKILAQYNIRIVHKLIEQTQKENIGYDSNYFRRICYGAAIDYLYFYQRHFGVNYAELIRTYQEEIYAIQPAGKPKINAYV